MLSQFITKGSIKLIILTFSKINTEKRSKLSNRSYTGLNLFRVYPIKTNNNKKERKISVRK